jgi:hypothetical protein
MLVEIGNLDMFWEETHGVEKMALRIHLTAVMRNGIE